MTEAAGLALFVRSGDALTLGLAADLSVTALVSGERVAIALFGEGLAAWVAAHRGDAVPAGPGPWASQLAIRRAQLGARPLAEAIAQCRELGGDGFMIWACSGDVERLALDPDALVRDRLVDDVFGLPTIWRRARGLRPMSL